MIRKSFFIKVTSSYYRALVKKLATTGASYGIAIGPFDPQGIAPQDLYFLLPFSLSCLLDWHLQMPASRQWPKQLLGSEVDINRQ